MIVRKYYPKGIINLKDYEIRAGCNPLFVRDTFGFFCCVNSTRLYRCRSPPFINFKLKNLKLIGGNNNGRTPKEKKI